jgi:ELWxxDGT repeat protein
MGKVTGGSGGNASMPHAHEEPASVAREPRSGDVELAVPPAQASEEGVPAPSAAPNAPARRSAAPEAAVPWSTAPEAVTGAVSTRSTCALVVDLNPGEEGSLPNSMLDAGPWVVFNATSPEYGAELWKTDGTAEGTTLVKDIRPGPLGSSPSRHALFAGSVYFSADDGDHGTELWRTDGSTAGTALVHDVLPGPDGSDPYLLTPLGGHLFFLASRPIDPAHPAARQDMTLWVSDGRGQAARELTDMQLPSFAVLDGVSYVMAQHDGGEQRLWSTDGTPEGTAQVLSFPWVGSMDLCEFEGALYFHATIDSTAGLWRSDGTAEGMVLLAELDQADRFTRLGDTLLFAGQASDNQPELWRTDGTAEGTLRVKDIREGLGGSDPQRFTVLNDTVLFTATVDGGHNALMVSDGTVEGTRELRKEGGNFLVRVGQHVYFGSTGSEYGFELWRSDGTPEGTELVADLRPGPEGSEVRSLTAAGDALYLSADDGVHGRELWRCAGDTR